MAKSTPVSTKVSDDLHVAKFTAERNQLLATKTTLERELSDIEQGITTLRSVSAIDKAVNDLRAEGVGSLDTVPGLHTKREAVQNRLRVICKAIESCERDLRDAESRASRRITEAARPEYTAIVQDMKQRIAALKDAIGKEAAFRNRLDDNGGSMGNGVLYPMWISGDLLNGWLANAAEFYGV